MADTFDVNTHQFFVPMTQYIRPNGHTEEIEFPVIDQETVDRAKECIANQFTYACEYIHYGVWSFYIVDDVAEFDTVTNVFSNFPNDNGETNRKNVSAMIKSWSVEQLQQRREQYIAEESK